MNIVRVWDLPTRVFHWTLAGAIVGLVITGQVGGGAMVWHFRLGYLVLTLLLFRVVWGFVGGYWSRFGSFLAAPTKLLAYLRGTSGGTVSVGHTPLGGYSVLALLLAGLAQVTTGLMSDDEILAAGPLVAKVPPEWVSMASFLHTEVFKLVLVLLVVVHLVAIAWYRWKRQENLTRAMLWGDKHLVVSAPSSEDSAGARLRAVVVLLACAACVGGLLAWAQ